MWLERVSNPGPLTYESGAYRLCYAARLSNRIKIRYIYFIFNAEIIKMTHTFILSPEILRNTDQNDSQHFRDRNWYFSGFTRSGHILSFLLPLFQEGQLSVTGESKCTKYWLTA